MPTPRIHVDFETRSIVNINLGADVYARHFSTSPIMLAINAPYASVREVIDFLAIPGYQRCIYPFAKKEDLNYRMIKPQCPAIILRAIREGWVFVAHNARFEQTIWFHICHKIWGWPMPTKWSCTAARARYWGLRASLDGAGSDLEIISRKHEDGKEFINNFCKPRKWKGAQKLGVIKDLWYEPHENPAGWQKGLAYCLGDTDAEMEIDEILPDLPPFEQQVWDLDFKMNIRGLPIDMPSVTRAIQFSNYFTAINFQRFEEYTNLRPTQRDRVLEYINQREEIDNLGDLRSKTLTRLTLNDMPDDLRDIITIRLETSKASIKKLERIYQCTDDDFFARGLFLYGGAHTMRWSAKRIQPQNFTRPNPDAPQEYMFEFLQHNSWDKNDNSWIEEAGIRFVRPLGYLATSMRGFIKPPEGFKLVVGDYAQIEARVLVWLARCLVVMEGFRNGEDVYVRFAGDHMYNRPYDDYFYFVGNERRVKKQFKRERQIAKSAVLGCGYGLGADKFVEYCDNSDIIISLEESKTTIRAYRDAHPEIADPNIGLWRRVEDAAKAAVANEGEIIRLAFTGVSFHVHRLNADRWWLIATLPSGRHIAYYRPKLHLGVKWGRTTEILSFRTEWVGKSYRENTYGGKLVENLVQAIARDICAQGAINVENAGYPVCGMVHDEIITMPRVDFGSHGELVDKMCALPAWITDLPVEAEGATMVRYGK